MSFILIKGHFKPKVGRPDGDSVRFLADDLQLWKLLEGTPVEPGTSEKSKDTVQLRFEAIDAIEKAATETLALEAKESLLTLIGYDPDKNPDPRGYILARMTDDKTRRPICFVFAGETPRADGTPDVYLDAKLVRQSINYKQMLAGYAYPLYYNTLYASLRKEFDAALEQAKNKKRGYWPSDKTRKGVEVDSHNDLATIPPVWPKLWRRLDTYTRKQNSLAGFLAFLEKANERIDVLSVMEERGLHDIIKVKGNKVRMTEPPENLRVVGKAGKRKR
jgi:endonuclease YncB( thermonuclease family)